MLLNREKRTYSIEILYVLFYMVENFYFLKQLKAEIHNDTIRLEKENKKGAGGYVL